MVVKGREVKPLKYFEGDPEMMGRIVQRFIPSNDRDRKQLVLRLLGAKKEGFDINEVLPNYVGNTVALKMYRQLGCDGRNLCIIKNLFSGYDIRTISPDLFNPMVRYVGLFMK